MKWTRLYSCVTITMYTPSERLPLRMAGIKIPLSNVVSAATAAVTARILRWFRLDAFRSFSIAFWYLTFHFSLKKAQ